MGQSRKQSDNRDESMQARLRLAAIVESSDDAIIGKDLNGIITDWNNGAQRLYGYSADEVIGKPISILGPSDRFDDLIEIMRKIRAGESVRHYETFRRKKNGTCVQVSLTVSPVVDTDGRIIGASAIARDISEHKRQEAALRESEEALRQKGKELSEAQRLARVGSWYHDAESGIVTWSEELYRIADLDPSSPPPTHKDLPRHFAPESWKKLEPRIQEALRDGTSYELDLEMARLDGTTRWVKAHGEPVTDTTGRIVALRGTAQDITERKLAEEALAGMSGRLLEAQEQERTRIARELHDDINQRIALVLVNLERLQKDFSPLAPAITQRLTEIQEHLSSLRSDVQALSHHLHSSKLEYLGLVTAAGSFCKELSQEHGVEVEFHSESVPKQLPREVALCLFRVLQESLQNAVKHSGGRFFKVSVEGSPTEIRLSVRDSGVGFEPELAKGTQGLGLTSMRERVRLVNGTISITSSPQSGAEIRVFVPLSVGKPTETKSAGA